MQNPGNNQASYLENRISRDLQRSVEPEELSLETELKLFQALLCSHLLARSHPVREKWGCKWSPTISQESFIAVWKFFLKAWRDQISIQLSSVNAYWSDKWQKQNLKENQRYQKYQDEPCDSRNSQSFSHVRQIQRPLRKWDLLRSN